MMRNMLYSIIAVSSINPFETTLAHKAHRVNPLHHHLLLLIQSKHKFFNSEIQKSARLSGLIQKINFWRVDE